MNKKFLGIRVGTIITVIACILTALVVWVLAKYRLDISHGYDTASLNNFSFAFQRLIQF